MRLAAGLPFSPVEAVKNISALHRPTVAASEWTAGAVGFSPRHLLWAALGGELLAAILLLASESVPPLLVRSLQLFLRF